MDDDWGYPYFRKPPHTNYFGSQLDIPPVGCERLRIRMGLEPRKSIGTSSFVVLATSASAVCTYIHEGLASLRAAGAIAVTAVISARMGASMTNKVKPKTLKKGQGCSNSFYIGTLCGFMISIDSKSAINRSYWSYKPT